MAITLVTAVSPFGGTFLTAPLSATWSYNQTFSVFSTQGWREVESDGNQTQVPIGQSGPFLVQIAGEGILCSSVIGNTVYVYQDGNTNGRGWTGSAIAHPTGVQTKPILTVVATSVQSNDQDLTHNNSAASVASVSLPATTATTIQTSASLAIGTYLITFSTNILGSGAGSIAVAASAGTSTVALSGQSTATATLTSGGETQVSLNFLCTVSVAGTVLFKGTTSSSGAGTTQAGASTGYTAVQIA